MKFFATILSVYVIFLIALPCIDEPVDAVFHKTELTQNPRQNHMNGIDLCTPFCTCQCCGTVVLLPGYSIGFSSISIPLEKQAEYTMGYVSSYLNAIWLPPKIS